MNARVRSSRRISGATALFVALFLAACGGSGTSSADPSTESSVTTSDVVPAVDLSVATTATAESSAPTSESNDERAPAATVVSSDQVLTVEIPEGAAPAGTEVRIVKLEASSMPEQWRIPGVAMAGYDLLPDGTEFTEPATITYRIDPSDFDLELADRAVPVALLVTQNQAGDFETVNVELSREGEMFVARAAITHFSPYAIMISEGRAITLRPPSISLPVDGEASVAAAYANLRDGKLSFDFVSLNSSWSAAAPFFASKDEDHGDLGFAIVSCFAPTDAVVPDAYVVTVAQVSTEPSFDSGDPIMVLAQMAGFGTVTEVKYVLGGDGTCGVDGTDSIGDYSSSSGSSPIDDPVGMATDIIQISNAQPDPNTNEFTIHLAGAGEGVAADVDTDLYQISGFIDGAEPWPVGGWDFSISYANGVLEPVAVLSRSVENGEATTSRISGASVDLEWVNPDEIVITVFNPDDGQIVQSFVIASSTRAFSDEATCNASCQTE